MKCSFCRFRGQKSKFSHRLQIVVQSLSPVRFFTTCQASLSITNCHLTNSSSTSLFSLAFDLLASGSFPVCRLFESDGQCNKGKTRSDQACSLSSLFLGKRKKKKNQPKPTHSSFFLFTATIPVKRPHVIRHLGHRGMIWHFFPPQHAVLRENEKRKGVPSPLGTLHRAFLLLCFYALSSPLLPVTSLCLFPHV